MARKTLEKAIASAAKDFALQIIDAVKGATLQELIALQEGKPVRRGRKPGRPAKKKAAKKTVKKKRVVKNYPKCAYPKCNKNRFPRGKGFCGNHWRQWKAGKIKAASTYKKPAAKKKVTRKKK
jgi:hypothetical protein